MGGSASIRLPEGDLLVARLDPLAALVADRAVEVALGEDGGVVLGGGVDAVLVVERGREDEGRGLDVVGRVDEHGHVGHLGQTPLVEREGEEVRASSRPSRSCRGRRRRRQRRPHGVDTYFASVLVYTKSLPLLHRALGHALADGGAHVKAAAAGVLAAALARVVGRRGVAARVVRAPRRRRRAQAARPWAT